MNLAAWLGEFLAPILDPLIEKAVTKALEQRGVIAKPNKELQNEAAKANDPAGLLGHVSESD